VNRPPGRVCPAVFIGAIRVKTRDGQVAGMAFYTAVGARVTSGRVVLGVWAGGSGGLAVPAGIENRGVVDVFAIVCGG
jgi:transposase-like protein